MPTKTVTPGKPARQDMARAEDGLVSARANRAQSETNLQHSQANLTRSEANLTRSEANLTRSEANLTRSEANLTRSESNLRQSEANLGQSQANLARADTELARAEANLALARDFGVAVVDSLPIPLAVLDRELRVRQINVAFGRIFAAGGERALGRSIDELIRRNDRGPPLREVIAAVATGAVPLVQHEIGCELAGGPGLMLLNAYPVAHRMPPDVTTPVVMVNLIDVSATRHVQRVEAALREKENLIKELHHRVKNNLQVISSLLELQALDTQDAKAQRRLKDSQERVRSMALIHEKLYQSRNLERIDMRDYVQSLAGSLAHLYGVAAGTVTVAIEVDDVHLDIDTAIPAGLILNELISNVYKYAFPDQRRGHLSIGLVGDGAGQLLMTVADDGAGLPAGMDFDTTQSLGLLIARSLSEQLGGALRYEAAGGARFSVRFPRRIEKRAG